MIIRYLILIAFSLGLADAAVGAELSVPDSLRKYRFLAKTSRDKKEYPEAIRYYREYLKYQPDDVKAHFFLGDVCYKVKDFAGAKQALKGAVALDSLHVNSNLRLYGIYMNEGAADSAATCLERVLLAKPGDTNYRQRLADLYRREGEIRKAITHYEQLVEKQERPDELIEMVAILYEDLGETEKALEWREKLMANGKGTVDVAAQREGLETMVRLQLETGDFKSAFTSLLQLARVDTTNRYSYYSRIATLAEKHNDADMRLRGWEGMVRANPRDLQTVAMLVEWNMNEGREKRATQWLERGLRVDPDHAHLQLMKGDLLVQQGAEEEALAAFEKAKADPQWETVAQQRIWLIRPPETKEEKLKKAFFGKKNDQDP